jgi:hypothetical protein
LPLETASKDFRDHSAQEWKLCKDDIKQLYVIEQKKLTEVMEAMGDRGFSATYVCPILPIGWHLSY